MDKPNDYGKRFTRLYQISRDKEWSTKELHDITEHLRKLPYPLWDKRLDNLESI